MIDQETETAYLSSNPSLPITITLAPDDTMDIPDDVYDILLEAFIAKAKRLGHDVTKTPNIVIGDWTIKAQLTEV